MADENVNNKIELFRTPDTEAKRRPPIFAAARIIPREKSPDLASWWRTVKRRKGIILLAWLVTLATVLAACLLQKPVYRAKTLLEIDRENPSLTTPAELLQLDEVSDAYLETQYKVLESDDLARRVIDQMSLGNREEFQTANNWWQWKFSSSTAASDKSSAIAAGGSDGAVREAVLSAFQQRLQVKPIRHSRTVEVGFYSNDPVLATGVVHALAASYIQKNLQARWDATQKTSEWLSKQLQDLQDKLERSQTDLQKYTTENGLLFLETSKGNSESVVNQSLRELQAELSKAQAARYEKESLYRTRDLTDYGSMPGPGENKVLQDLTVRLAELQRQRAQLLATFNDDYPKVIELQNQISEVQAALQREHQHAVDKISNEYYSAVRRESLLQAAFQEKQRQANQSAEKSVQYGILNREVDSNQNLYDGLLQKLKEAGVSAGLRASNIRVIDPGDVPFTPYAPKTALNAGLATVLGLALGMAMAFVLEHLDQTLKNAGDVDLFLHSATLAFIPSLNSLNRLWVAKLSRKRRGASIAASPLGSTARASLAVGAVSDNWESHKNSVLAEAFRGLRTSILLSKGHQPAKTILVTSAQSGEGKTTISMNLAISLAQLGRRVLLVDADMRRPSIHNYFSQPGSQLSRYLEGQASWQEMTYPSTVKGLYVLLCGPVPGNPSELLSSERMRSLVNEASEEFEFVIFDSPPLLDVADARILGSLLDTTVLVVKGARTHRQLAQYARSQLQSAGANVLGVVLNNLDVRLDDYPYYSKGRLSSAYMRV